MSKVKLNKQLEKDIERHKGTPYKPGQRYGHMVSVKSIEDDVRGKWIFEYDNGEKHTHRFTDVRGGMVNGKGRNHLQTHGESNTRFYAIWYNMKSRIYDPKRENYKYYGGKGVGTDWDDYEDFRNDMYESYQKAEKEYSEKISLDRIDSDGDYVKENCQWIPLSENCGKDNKSQS